MLGQWGGVESRGTTMGRSRGGRRSIWGGVSGERFGEAFWKVGKKKCKTKPLDGDEMDGLEEVRRFDNDRTQICSSIYLNISIKKSDKNSPDPKPYSA
jgi:hypothetical protein